MNKIVFFESTSKPEAIKCAELAVKVLNNYGAQCAAAGHLIEKMAPESAALMQKLDETEFERFADVMISFGGDGTMLAASRLMINTDIPIMGVNVGQLGFLAEYPVETLEQSLQDLIEGKFRIVDRSVIETVYNEETLFALNDYVISKKNSTRMITVNAYANKNYIGSVRADGVILTTPTGSTAYSLSCGGPILAPSAEVLCLTPISPHALTLRPLVIPDTNEIRLQVETENAGAYLVADGQIRRTIACGDSIVITKSKARVKMVKPNNSSYYDLLRNKLLWATNAEDHDNCNCEDKKSGDK